MGGAGLWTTLWPGSGSPRPPCGRCVDEVQAPALCRALAAGPVTVGELMASPWVRSERLGLMVLMLERSGQRMLVPDEAVGLAVGDMLLMAGAPGTQRAWDATLYEDDLMAYVLSGEAVASSWWGRRLFAGRHARRVRSARATGPFRTGGNPRCLAGAMDSLDLSRLVRPHPD